MSLESKYHLDKSVVFQEPFTSQLNTERLGGEVTGGSFANGVYTANTDIEEGIYYKVNKKIKSQRLKVTLTQTTSVRSVFNLYYVDGTSASLYLTNDNKFITSGIDSIYIDGQVFNTINTIPLDKEIDLVINFTSVLTVEAIEIGDSPQIGAAFVHTIDTTLGNGVASYTLPLRSGYNYSMQVNWGDGTTSTINAYNDSDITHTYSSAGVYQISIIGLCQAWYFNDGGDKDKLISINRWGRTGFISMRSAFYGCSNLLVVEDEDGGWCQNVTDFYFMFRLCDSVTTIISTNWCLGNATDLTAMFLGCVALSILDVSKWQVDNVILLSETFFNCPNLTNLELQNWQIQNVTNMVNLLIGVKLVTNIYDQILVNWNSIRTDWTNLTNNEIDFGFSQYTLGSAAETARTSIIANGATNLQDGGGV